MAASVLGKRSRISNENCIPTRVKRRALSLVTEHQTLDFDIAEDGINTRSVSQRKLPNNKCIVVEDLEQTSQENTSQYLSTPKTPRHRDALSNHLPETPRHRVIVGSRPNTPRTPRTPSTPSGASNSIFTAAKKAFTRGINPTSVVGRSIERAELQNFINEHVASGKGGSLYVSGPPGTGKSALTTEICHDYNEGNKLKYAYVNCMSVKNGADIYRLATSGLGLSNNVFEMHAKDILETESSSQKRQSLLLIVLDEIDQLLTIDHDVLYSLFEWSLAKTSKLLVIGIANALDLTDRFLPRLKARNTKPKLLPFLPYTVADIASVLSARARSLLPEGSAAASDFTPFLHPTAIQLIAKKVAAQTGDMRKAFDIAQRTIEVLDMENRDKLAQEAQTVQEHTPLTPSRSPLGEIANLSSPGSIASDSPTKCRRSPPRSLNTNHFSQLSPETAPRATLAHVVRVTSAAFNNGAVQRLKGLNLQQKAILCSLLALEHAAASVAFLPSPASPTGKRGVKGQGTQCTTSTPTIRSVFSAYSSLCKRNNMLHPLSNTEFRDVIASLETQSLVAGVDGKTGSSLFSGQLTMTPSKRGKKAFGGAAVDDKKVKACIAIKDMEAVIEGVGSEVLKMILRSDGLL